MAFRITKITVGGLLFPDDAVILAEDEGDINNMFRKTKHNEIIC